MRVEFIDPGAFRVELRLQRAVVTADGSGGHDANWQEIATLFGHIAPLAAESRFGAGQTHERVTHRVTIRHRPDVESGMRFVRQERAFDILSLYDPDETGRYLVCRAREAGR